jgi:lipopolysaccharide/colanic/teichoic acid biosynthesis glycosyltransferase
VISRESALAKRVFDLCLASLGLLTLAPVLLAIAMAIRLDSPGPALYRQVRVGYHRKPFQIYKFRTMVVNADELLDQVLHLNLHAAEGGDPRLFKIPSDPRVTRLGTWLRRHCLDELPQLFNVIRGEMSLVGPRPLLAVEDQHVRGAARIRTSVLPGITGPWQVQGRNDLTFEEMMVLDQGYVTDQSLLRDLRIILRTIPVACRSQRAC